MSKIGDAIIICAVLLLLGFMGAAQVQPAMASAIDKQNYSSQKVIMKTPEYKDLREAAWQHRVLIVTMQNAAEFKAFKATLMKNAEGIIERKLLVITLLKQSATAYTGDEFAPSLVQINELNERLQDGKALLIGLDTGSKAVYDQIDLRLVFAEIDGMPMRRSELRD